MRSFKIKEMNRWHALENGKPYLYAKAAASRGVRLSFIATGDAVIWASDDPTMEGKLPVAVGSGRMDVEITSAVGLYIEVEAKKGVCAFVRDHAQPQPLSKTPDAESFVETDITPAPAGGSYEQILRAVNAQSDARHVALEAEIERLKELVAPSKQK